MTPRAQVCFCLAALPESTVRHRQRIARHRRLGVERQRLLDVLHGGGIVFRRQGRAAKAKEGYRETGILCQRLLQRRLGGVRFTLSQVLITEVDQRREIGGPQRQRALEGCGRVDRIALDSIGVRQVIRPPRVLRRECLCIHVARHRGVGVLRRDEEISQLAMRLSQFGRRRVPITGLLHDHRVLVCDLPAQRCRHA